MQYMLIGNPNVGKTTLFNNLTGANAHVGNWSGVTVDKLAGFIKGRDDLLIDLPGAYSVTPSSEDEGVVTYALMNESYEGMLNIIDGTHLKRNLHLTIQLLEAEVPVLIAVNMVDALTKKGQQLDVERLSDMLGVKACLISARKNEGMSQLIQTLPTLQKQEGRGVTYFPVIEEAIQQLSIILKNHPQSISIRWLAIQLLEGNKGVLEHLKTLNADEMLNIQSIIGTVENRIIEEKLALSLKGAIFNCRREFIHDIYNTCLKKDSQEQRTHLTKLDRCLTHPIIGLVVFFSLMFLIYMLTFDFLGNPISDGFAAVIDSWIAPYLEGVLLALGIDEGGLIYGAIMEGLVAGVGGVIVFLPQILILFFFLSLMEATGYMARVAMVMDYIFSKFGLNGKAIVPLITGFGCNVPAIMATRTIPDRAERIKTMTIIPFMSCSARLPVYVLFVGLFFPNNQAFVIMILYLLGIMTALLSAKLLSVSVFKKSEDYFILEVPPYRLPQFKNMLNQTFNRAIEFFRTAGKFIVIGSLILWFLQAVGPSGVTETSETSYLALIGGFFAPIFAPIGFGTWQTVSSLVVGFLAKELVASSMLVIAGGEAGLLALFTPLQGLSFLIFSLLYIPCLATVGVMYRESKSWKTTFFMVLFGLSIAYMASFIVYQIGMLL